MQLTYQKLKPFALSYLTAPLAVFFAGYLRAPFAVAGLAVLAFLKLSGRTTEFKANDAVH